jgi:triacylglycerol lipase
MGQRKETRTRGRQERTLATGVIGLLALGLAACGEADADSTTGVSGSSADAPSGSSTAESEQAHDADSEGSGAWPSADELSASAEPLLQTSEAKIEATLHCPDVFEGERGPVLLVHGTGTNTDLAWSWGYAPLLTDLGFDVCTIDLPGWSWDDAQIATEYVVYAIRAIAARSGRTLAVIGHSQGTLELRWAFTWWPSLRALVSDYVGLAGPDHGTAPAKVVCTVPLCRAAAWQMRASSAFLGALNAVDETPGDIDYTSVYSTTDTTSVAPTAVLDGASNVAIQAICRNRQVSHGGLLGDAVAFALVLDALDHEGPADPGRIDASICNQDRAPGIDAATAGWMETRGAFVFIGTYLGGALLNAEPSLAPYVTVP